VKVAIGGAGLRVLVAEEDAVNRRLAAGLLEKQGHVVQVTATIGDAQSALLRDAYDVFLVGQPGLDGTPIDAAGAAIGYLPRPLDPIALDRELRRVAAQSR
jgi:hypothetical protein